METDLVLTVLTVSAPFSHRRPIREQEREKAKTSAPAELAQRVIPLSCVS